MVSKCHIPSTSRVQYGGAALIHARSISVHVERKRTILSRSLRRAESSVRSPHGSCRRACKQRGRVDRGAAIGCGWLGGSVILELTFPRVCVCVCVCVCVFGGVRVARLMNWTNTPLPNTSRKCPKKTPITTTQLPVQRECVRIYSLPQVQ